MLSAFELKDPSDQQLLSGVKALVAEEREATAQLIAHLGEIDARRLFLAEGSSSLFKYCTEVLHLSEAAAYTGSRWPGQPASSRSSWRSWPKGPSI